MTIKTRAFLLLSGKGKL